MPVTPEHVGRCYPPSPPYEVSAAKIAEFSRALGEDHPALEGDTPVAPPTFVMVIAAAAWQDLFGDPELDLALNRVVHGDQRFRYVRPLRAGDRVRATLTVDSVRNRGAADLIGISVGVETVDGEQVCTASSSFFHTRPAQAVGA